MSSHLPQQGDRITACVSLTLTELAALDAILGRCRNIDAVTFRNYAELPRTLQEAHDAAESAGAKIKAAFTPGW